jgi:membrane protein YqaA with SNARE-associated domain
MKFETPLMMLALLGCISYLGGVISYHIGVWLSGRPKIKAYTEKKLVNYIKFVKKWGGAFIVIAALFPFSPFSMVVIALSLLKYPYKWFLILALTRLVRFVLQGLIFFDILNIDSWLF